MISKERVQELVDQAIQARERAYTPYSKFNVGAVVIDTSGKEVTGCNVENASYGLSMCAERTAIFKAVSEGSDSIETVVVVGDTDGPISPCGACRQVIAEFASDDFTLILANLKGETKVMTKEEMLPYGFSPKDLT
ncbi:cytidine deaminase [Exiguobacterium qingdaonense]|uniref:cytidine deaminase n=1 Tax=Exiguobacterium qingdaonense TaxID=2751251 RepID=UPI001BE7FAC1|nr:cytidine deaminase [Exiguobacterium qingdaonense]